MEPLLASVGSGDRSGEVVRASASADGEATESARPAGLHPLAYATTLGTLHQHTSSSLAVTTYGAPDDTGASISPKGEFILVIQR